MTKPKTDPIYARWRWRVFGGTWLAYAGFYFTRKAFSVAKLGMLEDPTLGFSPILASNIDIAFSVAYSAGQLLWGISADRFGPRRIVIAGMLASTATAVAMGLSTTVVLLGLFFFIQGLCQSTGWAPLTKNLGFWFSSKERGRVIGLWSTNHAFGGMVASPLAGWFAYSVFEDWRWAFFSSSAMLFLAAIAFYFLQRDRPRDVGLEEIEKYHGEQMAVVDAHDSPEEEKEGSWELIGKVFRSPPVLVLAGAYFLLKPIRYAFLFWGPVIASERLASDSFTLAATLPAAFEAAGLVAPGVIGFVSDTLFQARRFPVCVLSLFILSVVLFLVGPLTNSGSTGWLLVAFFLVGFFQYGPDTMVVGTAAVEFGTNKGAGSAAGFINGCGSCGQILGVALPGYLMTWYPDADTTLMLFYGFSGAALVASLLLMPFWNLVPSTGKRTAP
jgi:OPA family sugar phosphate sensor protein UhpC-like MFS transporter